MLRGRARTAHHVVKNSTTSGRRCCCRRQSTEAREAYNAFNAWKEGYKPDEGVSAPGNSLKNRPIAIKDNISTTDFPTTCASAMLRNYQSPYDATVVKKLRNVGAVICGKTNMDEFGMGSYSTHSFFGPVRNIGGEDGKTLVAAGGSSGGSAVAVVSEQAWAALGTDTGGSIRLPAAMTGIFGLKPSYGMVSRYGVVPYANSLDTVGVLANNVTKIRAVFNTINGVDENDPTNITQQTRDRLARARLTLGRNLYTSVMATSQNRSFARPLRIGLPLEFNPVELGAPIRAAWLSLLQELRRRGHEIIPVSLPLTRQALSAYYVIATAEACSNLAKYDGVRYGTGATGSAAAGGVLYAKHRGEQLGPEVKKRILLGSYSLSSAAYDNYFLQAQKVRRLVQRDFNDVFAMPNVLLTENPTPRAEGVDVLVCPTCPVQAPTWDEIKNIDPIREYTTDVLTVPASLAGIPSLSVPYLPKLESAEHAPDGEEEPAHRVGIGMQIIGQYGAEELLLDVAEEMERWGILSAPPKPQQIWRPVARKKSEFKKAKKPRRSRDEDGIGGFDISGLFGRRSR